MYKAVPYYWSTRGYGLFINSGAPAEIDLAATSHSTVSLVVPDDVLEFYVIRAAGPEDALAPLQALTGDVPLPPRWAFGTWVSSSFQPDTQQSRCWNGPGRSGGTVSRPTCCTWTRSGSGRVAGPTWPGTATRSRTRGP